MFGYSSFRKKLLFWLLLKAALLSLFILFSPIGLGPDEAQYWTWSKSLDFGYYSKPPGIAWQIFLGTSLFGDSEWGVRSTALLIGFLLPLGMFELARSANLRANTAFWTALFFAFSPLGILGSLLATTDGGLLLFWTGALYLLFSGIQKSEGPNLILFGLLVGIGALFKWTAFLLWPICFLALALYVTGFKWSKLFLGIFVSLCGLLPSIWWNAHHDWVTFKHVFSTLHASGASSTSVNGNFFEFFGAQALLICPVFFGLLLLSLVRAYQKRKDLSPFVFLSFVTTAAFFLVMFVASCFQKLQGNWMIFAYPMAFLLIGWGLFEEGISRPVWKKIGLGVSIALSAFVLIMPFFYSVSEALSYRYHPFKHNTGWKEMEETLSAQGYDFNKHFLASDKYQLASLLSFYSEGKKRAYFINLSRIRNNQFSYWPSLADQKGAQEGFFIWVENIPHLKEKEKKKDFYQEKLLECFDEVEYKGFFPLIENSYEVGKGMLIFRCQSCKSLPELTNQF